MTVKHWQDTWTNTDWHWRKLSLSQRILAILVLVAVSTTMISAIFNQTVDGDWLAGFWQNFSTEMMGAIITFVLFEQVFNRQQREETQKQLDAKELQRLKALMASDELVVTKIAVAELRAKGWLTDGSLKNAYLEGANLQGMKLSRANLSGVNLSRANLQGANLSHANLQGANLRGAKLEGADLSHTNLEDVNLNGAKLQGTKLRFANLERAHMDSAKLEGADLSGAKLEGADLSEAKLQGAKLIMASLNAANMYRVHCNHETILPDNTRWREDVAWSVFGAGELNDYGWAFVLRQRADRE